MPTVAELSAPYANFMLGPRRGPDVCSQCFNLTDGYNRCYSCVHGGRFLDAMVPVSYSVAGEQLHYALAGYKRLDGVVARRFTLGLAAVLWRHLAQHERCLARASNVDTFTLATCVPSSSLERDASHPLDDLVSLVGLLAGRYERLLRRSETPAAPHEFSPAKYEPLRDVTGQDVLLVDDTWTKGANAQSAAAALKAAGAEAVAAVVIGRYVNRGWRQNDRHLRSLPQPFVWTTCALCAPPQQVLPANGSTADGESTPNDTATTVTYGDGEELSQRVGSRDAV
jgi:hypothetical protein